MGLGEAIVDVRRNLLEPVVLVHSRAEGFQRATMYRQQLTRVGRLYEQVALPEARPDVRETIVNNESWTRQSGICYDSKEYEKFLRIGCGDVAAMAYVNESKGVCQFGADLISWLFMFDDRFGEGPFFADRAEMNRSFAGFVALVRDLELPPDPNPFHSALMDLMRRAGEMGPCGWNELFAGSLEFYTSGCKREYAMRYEGHRPSLEEYVEIRRGSIGTYPILDVIDLSLPEIVAYDPKIQRCREITADLLGWVNDMFSFRKEYLDHDPCNLVKVIGHDLRMGYEAAYEYAIEMHDRRFMEFFGLHDEIVDDRSASVSLKTYVDSLKNWIVANHRWASRTLRYHF